MSEEKTANTPTGVPYGNTLTKLTIRADGPGYHNLQVLINGRDICCGLMSVRFEAGGPEGGKNPKPNMVHLSFIVGETDIYVPAHIIIGELYSVPDITFEDVKRNNDNRNIKMIEVKDLDGTI